MSERTPMQWDASKNAGFTTGTQWLPPTELTCYNVQTEVADDDSMLNWYKQLIALRRANPV